jgi:hypothetical protein
MKKEKEWTKHQIFLPVDDLEEDAMDRKLRKIERKKKQIKRGDGIRGV